MDPGQSGAFGIYNPLNNLPANNQQNIFDNSAASPFIIDYSPFQQQLIDTNGPNWWSNLPTNAPIMQPPLPQKKSDDKKQKRHRNRKPKVNKIDRMSDSGDLGEIPPDMVNDAPLINLEAKSPLIWSIGSFFVCIIDFICSYIQGGGFASVSINPLYGPDSSTLLQMGAKYGPFIYNGEYWRFITAIWPTTGVIHLAIVIFLALSTYQVERDSGFFRTMIVYLVSGVYGFILSSLLIPESVSAGSTGALMGLLGIRLLDVISSWRGLDDPMTKIILILFSIMATLALGLSPYLDNFVHIGGLIMGLLFAITLLPNLTFGKMEAICHGFMAFIAFPAMAFVFMITLVYFFRRTDTSEILCEFCYSLNCLNLTGWCPSIGNLVESGNVYYLT